MLYIRTLLSPRSRSTQEAHVSDLLSRTGVKGNGQLKNQSNSCLITTLNQSQAPDKFMRALLGKLLELDTPDQLAKLLTLMHSTVSLMEYQGEVLQQLSNLKIGCNICLKGEGFSWFLPFYKAYISYLARLPSVSQVLLRAKLSDQSKLSTSTLLQDVYRLINQVNLIIEVVNGLFNTIGRYYKEKIKVYHPLFSVIWVELMAIYDYMRRAINRIFSIYEEVKVEKLKVFLEIVGEIELITDKMEDFLMNKYFVKAKIEQRLYVFAQQVAKVEYYLKCNGEVNSARCSILKV